MAEELEMSRECVHVLIGPHLKGLEAHGGAVSTVHDEVFAVVPQQAVGHVTQQLFRPPGHLLALQRRAAAHLDAGTGKVTAAQSSHCHHLLFSEQHLVRGVDEYLGSVGKVLHRVHPHTATLRRTESSFSC